MGNICVERGCIGGCCRAAKFEVSRKELALCFPTARRVAGREFNQLNIQDQVVYTIGLLGAIRVRIVSFCPNLDILTGNCRAQEYKPRICRELPVGSENCNHFFVRYQTLIAHGTGCK